jgi:hypothetical protein
MYFSGIKLSRDTKSVNRFSDSTYFTAIIHKPEEDLIPDSIGEPPQGIKNILNLQKREQVEEPKKPYYIPGHTPADFLNAPAIDIHDSIITLPAPEAEGAEEAEAEVDLTGVHRNPEFIAHLQSPEYDNATTAGAISDPLVVEHVNKAYHLAVPGLELVKSRGGRGGEGGAGYKLTLNGMKLDDPGLMMNAERMLQVRAILQEMHTHATGRTARRIERDIKSINKVYGQRTPALAVGGGGAEVAPADEVDSSASESESGSASESESGSDEDGDAPAYAGVKYTLHEGSSGHDMTAWNKEKTEELAGALGIPNVGYKKLVDLKKAIVEFTKGGTA